jgi:prepilin-type N-terminal cleavage/methylation domain-containing protein
MIPVQKNMRAQAGFTLVELAIVMIIIGLLIAGILKGQQLIANARVTSQVAQFKGIDAAISTFKDMYAGLPGDILTPSTRLPNCLVAPCATAGDGNGAIAGAFAGVAGESIVAFPQLAAADLLTGINQNFGGGGAAALTWGGDFPAAKTNGGIHVGSLAGNALPTSAISIVAASVRGGLYLSLDDNPNGAVSAATGALTANEAQRIDTKLDDGAPDAGSVFPAGTVGNCTLAGPPASYNEAKQGLNCNLYVRIQG